MILDEGETPIIKKKKHCSHNVVKTSLKTIYWYMPTASKNILEENGNFWYSSAQLWHLNCFLQKKKFLMKGQKAVVVNLLKKLIRIQNIVTILLYIW